MKKIAIEHGDERLPPRFWKKAEPTSGHCWLWRGAKSSSGYGQIKAGGRLMQAHRFAFLTLGGRADGLELDHLCRNRACVNPAHLEPVTRRENILRGESPSARAARRTHCPKGHPYSGENLYIMRTARGEGRQCRACNRLKLRAARSTAAIASQT